MSRHEEVLVALSLLSLALLVVGAFAGPFIIARLPDDYFVAPPRSDQQRTPGRVLIALIRNVVGALLLLVGVALLVLPGQGLLTVLAALFIMKFPAKSALLRRCTASSKVRRSLNWMRRKMHRPELRFDED